MTPESDRLAQRADDNTPATGGVKLNVYLFVEEQGRLRVLESAGEFVVQLILWGLLALGGGGAAVATVASRGFDGAGWWLLIPAGPGLLGLWLLCRNIRRGRTLWLFDRESGYVFHRGKILRPMSSITHIGFFGMEVPKDVAEGGSLYYVWFAPNQGHEYVPKDALGLRKDLLGFGSMKDASQAATILSSYLGVEVVSEVL